MLFFKLIGRLKFYLFCVFNREEICIRCKNDIIRPPHEWFCEKRKDWMITEYRVCFDCFDPKFHINPTDFYKNQGLTLIKKEGNETKV